MNNDKTSIENILKMSDGKLDRKTLENAAQSGDASSLVNKLSDKDKQKLDEILSDKQKLAEVLKSPQAKMLLKLFGGKNG